MAKYSQAFKLSVVQHYFEQYAGYKTTGHHYGLYHDAVRKWFKIYKQHGEAGLARQRSKTVYPVAFKHQVVLIILNDGLSSREAAQHFKIKELWMLVRRLRQYQADGTESLQPKPKGR